jgi:hypothetical protein
LCGWLFFLIADADDDGKCDSCSTSLRGEPEQPDQPNQPSEPQEPEKESNVFSFLTEFLNNLLDFFRKLFGIK